MFKNIRSSLKKKSIRKVIIQSGLFDAIYYLKNNADVRKAGINPLDHYMNYGEREGRKPNVVFNPIRYLDFYKDIQDSEIQALYHYILHGEREGRQTSLYFDPSWYSKQYKDVSESKIGLMSHFLTIGLKENRRPSANFDPDYYISNYSDVSVSGLPALVHFLKYGVDDKRHGVNPEKNSKTIKNPDAPEIELGVLVDTIHNSKLFDKDYYLKNQPELINSKMNLIEHYITVGEKDGFMPNDLFDPHWYLEINRDVKQAKMSPLFHYIKYGEKAGRKASAKFDPFWYQEIHQDVKEAKISPLRHYLNNGIKEGRIPSNCVIPKYNACKRIVERFSLEWNQEREKSFLQFLNQSKEAYENMGDNLVSIIMPTYNREETIKPAISSVLAQSHQNFELIVSDDGSIDDTETVVKKFNDPRIVYIKQENKGVSAARNLGLEKAKGDFIFFLDSDNVWRKDFLKNMLTFLEVRNIDSAYSGMALTKDFKIIDGYIGQDYDLISLQEQNFIDLNCFCYRQGNKQYRFDEKIKRLVDWDLILTIALDKPMFYAPFIGVDYYTGDNHVRITNSVVTQTANFQELQSYVQVKSTSSLQETKLITSKSDLNKIAIVLHVTQQENTSYILDLFKRIPYDFDLYVTTSMSLDHLVFHEIINKFPFANLYQYKNIGADINPLINLLPSITKYKAVLKLHNQTETFPFELMKRILFEELLKDENSVTEIIECFNNNENVTAIGCEPLYLKSNASQSDIDGINYILDGKKAVSNQNFGFFIGNMFWLNPNKLSQLIPYCSNKLANKNEYIQGDLNSSLSQLIGYVLFSDESSKIGLINAQKLSLHNAGHFSKNTNAKEIIDNETQDYLAFYPSLKKGNVFFHPDYRITNPYQNLMYDGLDNLYNILPGTIDSALENQKYSETPVVFHLQWTSVIISGSVESEVKANVVSLLKKLKVFIERGGIFVWTIHNLVSHDGQFQKIEKSLCNYLSKFAHYIHVHSKQVQKLVSPHYEIPNNKLIVGPHGHYIETYPNTTDESFSRTTLGYDNECLIFLFLGQVRNYKGIDLLLASFIECNNKFPKSKIELIIAGKPVNYSADELIEKCSQYKNIRLDLKEIPNEELQIYLNAADFMVTPYKQILTSGSVYLSLSFGLPVIAPNKGLLTEILNHNENALLYNSQDSGGLSAVMSKAIGLKTEDLKKFKIKAKEKAVELDWSKMQDKISKSFVGSIVPDSKIKTIKLRNGVSRQILIRQSQIVTKTKTEVAIVILHYKHTQDTINAVRSALEQKDVSAKVIIVSNDEDLYAFIKLSNLFPDVTIIQSPGNIGYAGGNNIALELIDAEAISHALILNPDAVMTQGSLRKLLDYSTKNPKCGIIGPRIVYGDNPETVWFAGASINFEDGLETEHMGIGKKVNDLSMDPIESDYITGACMLLKTEIVSDIGLLPEEYFLYFEETDYCITAKQNGYELKVFPDVEVLHFKRSEEGNIPSLYYLYYFCRNAILMTLKHCPEKINKTEAKLLIKAKLWLSRIKHVSPDELEQSKKAINSGIADGRNKIENRIDLLVRLK